MEYVDLFCTDESYAPVNVDKTFLMPNLMDQDVEVEAYEEPDYTVDETTGEIIDEDIDEVVDMSDFADFNNDDDDEVDQFSETCEEQLSYQEQVIEYNNSILHQYEGVKGVEFTYDENGLIEVHFTEEYNESQAPEAEELEDPFADMPIIDDEEMDFLDEKPTLGKQRKGFQDGEDE